jgi:hypothetical protein
MKGHNIRGVRILIVSHQVKGKTNIIFFLPVVCMYIEGAIVVYCIVALSHLCVSGTTRDQTKTTTYLYFVVISPR